MNNSNDIAISAANCYRAIDALLDDLEQIDPTNPEGIIHFERFCTLHKEFYEHIIHLNLIETWNIDAEFEREVDKEIENLKIVLDYLKRDSLSLREFTGKITGRTNKIAENFACCVDTIFQWYAIDPDTNEIVYVDEVG